MGEARYDAKDGVAWTSPKAKAVGERFTVDEFTVELLHGIGSFNLTGFFWVPLTCVDAVEDATRLRGPCADKGIESFAKFRRLNFLSVRWAYRGHSIWKRIPALQFIAPKYSSISICINHIGSLNIGNQSGEKTP